MKRQVGKKEKQVQQPREWLYLAKGDTTLKGLSEKLVQQDGYETELWEEAGVLEIILPSGDSVDIEEGSVHEKDELLLATLQKEGADKVFVVTLGKESYEEAQKVMQKMIFHEGGIFCVDNDTLSPIYRG